MNMSVVLSSRRSYWELTRGI